MDINEVKEKTAAAAVDALVKDGMKLGLGTGTTARFAVRRIAENLAKGKLKNIKAVPSSFQTVIECENNGIPLFSLNSKSIGGSLDLAIDGADEIDPEHRCVKGGGGAMLLEKIIAYSSDLFVIMADESKLTERLGIKFPVPVEVIPEAKLSASLSIEKLGASVILREAKAKAGPVITDKGNFILDILFKETPDPAAMEAEINKIPGVVENGFFVWPPLNFKADINKYKRPQLFIGFLNGAVERQE